MRWRTSASLASPICSLSASAIGSPGKLKRLWNQNPAIPGTLPFWRGWLSQAQDYSNWKRYIKLHKNMIQRIQKSKLPTPLHNKAGVELLVVWAWVFSISLSHLLSSPIYALEVATLALPGVALTYLCSRIGGVSFAELCTCDSCVWTTAIDDDERKAASPRCLWFTSCLRVVPFVAWLHSSYRCFFFSAGAFTFLTFIPAFCFR